MRRGLALLPTLRLGPTFEEEIRESLSCSFSQSAVCGTTVSVRHSVARPREGGWKRIPRRRGYVHMASAKFSGFLTPPPRLHFAIHATSHTTSAIGVTPFAPPTADIICTCPLITPPTYTLLAYTVWCVSKLLKPRLMLAIRNETRVNWVVAEQRKWMAFMKRRLQGYFIK